MEIKIKNLMIRLHFDFENQSKRFEIIVPRVDQKINYYYESTDKLHAFDEVSIFYCIDEKKYY